MVTNCSQCNSPMCCCPEGNCWCANAAKLAPDPNATACLCPECLREKLQESQAPPRAKAHSA